MDREQLERFAGQPEVLRDPGDYTLRIEEVQMAEDRLSIRPLCMVVGGDSGGNKSCPETYDFHEGGENAAAIRNLYGWGVRKQELMGTGGDVKSIGALLEGMRAPGSLTPGGVSATSPDIASGGAIDVGLPQAGGSKVAATDA